MGFRLDRFTTLYVVHPLQRQGSNLSVPVLMYHSIADEDENDVRAYFRTATSSRVFADQIASLHEAGYEALGVSEAVKRLKSHSQTMSRGVVITFDDGFHNFYTNAFPILNRYSFTATVYLPTAYIGENHLSFKGKKCMTWNEVRELKKHGISFGSHTVTHPKLYGLPAKAINEEVLVSKQTIEQNLSCAVDSFAYPYAFPEIDTEFKGRLRAILCQAGYKNGVCTTVGRSDPNSDPFFLKRLPVNSDDDPQFFQAKLAGAYDWLAKPQYFLKTAKNWVSSRRQP